MTFIGYVIGMILAGLFYAFCSYIGISMYFKKVKRKQEKDFDDYMEKLKADMKGVSTTINSLDDSCKKFEEN